MSSKQKPLIINTADQYGLTDLIKASSPETSKLTEPESTLKLLDSLGPTVSSFWTQNVDFFDYPAICFDEEGSASWAKIINENIFQPFLPKNRTILQHCLKVYKKEEELYQQRTAKSFLSALADADNPARKMSCRLTGDPSSADRIGKFLSEMNARLEKHPRPISSRVKNAKKFALRSAESCKAILRKRAFLSNEEETKGLVNHRMYDLNRSQREIRNDGDFFDIYNADGIYESRNMDSNSMRAVDEKKSVKVPSIKALGAVSIMVNSGYKIEQGKQSDRMRVREENTSAKKMFRRKSCCCSECGGISTLEKLTVNLVNTKNKNEEKQEQEVSIPQIKVESIALPSGGKSWRQSRMAKEGPSSSALKPSNNLLIDLSGDDRRKSYQESVQKLDPRTPSRFHPLIRTPTNMSEALRGMGDHSHHSHMLKPVGTSYNQISLTVPGHDVSTRKSILRVRTPREADLPVTAESTAKPAIIKVSKAVSNPEQKLTQHQLRASHSVLMRNKSDAARNMSASMQSRTVFHKINTSETVYGEEPSKLEVIPQEMRAKKHRNKGPEWKSNGAGIATSPSPIRSPVLTGLTSPLGLKSPKKNMIKKSRKGCTPSICNDKDISKIYTTTSEKVLPWLPANSGITSPFATLRSAERQATLSSPLKWKPYVKAGDIVAKLRASDEKYRPVIRSKDTRMAALVC